MDFAQRCTVTSGHFLLLLFNQCNVTKLKMFQKLSGLPVTWGGLREYEKKRSEARITKSNSISGSISWRRVTRYVSVLSK
jgi:hypothetical protein